MHHLLGAGCQVLELAPVPRLQSRVDVFGKRSLHVVLAPAGEVSRAAQQWVNVALSLLDLAIHTSQTEMLDNALHGLILVHVLEIHYKNAVIEFLMVNEPFYEIAHREDVTLRTESLTGVLPNLLAGILVNTCNLNIARQLRLTHGSTARVS